MPVLDSDIVVYGAQNHAEDDSSVQGGAIDTTVRLVFVDIDPAGTIEAVSDNAGDTTQDLTVVGLNAAGEVVTEQQTLNGTTPVAFSETIATILKATLSGAAAGNVTVREAGGGDTLMIFEPGLLQIRRPFYLAAAEASGGAQRKYYEKIFFRNNNASLSLTNAVISELSDPSGKIAFALETSLDGTGTSANRRTAPASGVTAFDSNPKNVANNQNHTAGAAQGVWLELTLDPGDPAQETSYTLRESGTTT